MNMARRLEHLSFKDRLRAGLVQCGEDSTEILLGPFMLEGDLEERQIERFY